MTPQQKAQELVDKYRTYVVMWTGGVEVENENVKQCALIAVDEIIIALKFTNDSKHYIEQHKVWQQVKEEIKNL